jgi:hypothetical protein
MAAVAAVLMVAVAAVVAAVLDALVVVGIELLMTTARPPRHPFTRQCSSASSFAHSGNMSATLSTLLSLRPTLVGDLTVLFVFYKDPEAIHMAALTARYPLYSEGYIAPHLDLHRGQCEAVVRDVKPTHQDHLTPCGWQDLR